MTRKSFVRRAVSPLLWPIVLLYALGVRLKNAAYAYRRLKPQPLSWPVVSVGNLSVGGTGKTPVVMLLARLLTERGWTVDVLSRGYGRSSRNVVRVDPPGSPAEYGDEPLLMARSGISVYVGADRYQAGLLAEKAPYRAEGDRRRLHILDDGLQHRKLARAVDIVLVQRADLRDEMLPVGRLREPLSALERADIVVLRAEDADLADRVRLLMRRKDAACIWLIERRTTFPSSARDIPSAVAFCGLGDPDGFFQELRRADIPVQKEIVFRDHHVYTKQDVARLLTVARSVGAKCFITTEKDSVRFSGALRAEVEAEFPLLVAGLEVSLRAEARSVATLEALLAWKLQVPHNNVR